MRETKFRCWDKDLKKMFYGGFSVDGSSGMIIDVGWIAEGDGKFGVNCILMQYIGFKDKNDKEIFDGDVLKWEQGVGLIIMPVKEDEYATGFFPFSRTAQIPTPIPENVEVIGNICENPELLELIKGKDEKD